MFFFLVRCLLLSRILRGGDRTQRCQRQSVFFYFSLCNFRVILMQRLVDTQSYLDGFEFHDHMVGNSWGCWFCVDFWTADAMICFFLANVSATAQKLPNRVSYHARSPQLWLEVQAAGIRNYANTCFMSVMLQCFMLGARGLTCARGLKFHLQKPWGRTMGVGLIQCLINVKP